MISFHQVTIQCSHQVTLNLVQTKKHKNAICPLQIHFIDKPQNYLLPSPKNSRTKPRVSINATAAVAADATCPEEASYKKHEKLKVTALSKDENFIERKNVGF